MSSNSEKTRRLGGTPPITPGERRFALPVAAILFAAASVLNYMSLNLAETAVPDVIPALIGATGYAIVVWLLVVAVRRRADTVAAVIACLWVVASLYYFGLFRGLNDWIGGEHTMAAVLPIVIVALLVASYAVLRSGALDAPLHLVLSVIAAVMVATPVWKVSVYEWRNGDARAVYDPNRAEAEVAAFAGPVVAGAAGSPDIFHFVFDRYGSAETLRRTYGVDADVGVFLRQHGFYVADRSHSNYLKTGHSLASTFYMDYLDLLQDDPRIAGNSWHTIFAMLRDHRAARFLQDQGYAFLQFGSWWNGTHWNARADENHPYGFGEFTMYYLRQTALRTVGFFSEGRLAGLLAWDNGQCQRVGRQVEQIKAIADQPEPIYVFAHFLLPHDPYAFAADGTCVSHDTAEARGSTQGYLDQVSYANRLIEDIVAALQERDQPPVILIQTDEGPYPIRDYQIPWQMAAPEELRIKTSILNAYFFPDGDYRLLSPETTPVNSYRVLFNKYFGASYPILPDRVYTFPNDWSLYSFDDVTDRVRSAEASARATDPGSGAPDGDRPQLR